MAEVEEDLFSSPDALSLSFSFFDGTFNLN
jgi:hypothetical protein